MTMSRARGPFRSSLDGTYSLAPTTGGNGRFRYARLSELGPPRRVRALSPRGRTPGYRDLTSIQSWVPGRSTPRAGRRRSRCCQTGTGRRGCWAVLHPLESNSTSISHDLAASLPPGTSDMRVRQTASLYSSCSVGLPHSAQPAMRRPLRRLLVLRTGGLIQAAVWSAFCLPCC
jgi:hypothetical protein